MKKNILYLTKSNTHLNYGLIFPSEIEDENYYGIGNLYIPTDVLKPTYNIQAIRNDEIINIELILNKNGIYTCDIEDIGKFNFFVEELHKPIEYIGRITQYKNMSMHYRLRLINTDKAEYFAREYNFYFIGNE